MKKCAIGFIGYGNMAQAIVASLSSDTSKFIIKNRGFKFSIAVSDADASKLANLPNKVVGTTDNAALVNACDLIVLAIKPQQAEDALRDIDFSGKIIMSIMASVTMDAIKTITGNTTDKIVRVMPNLNARVGSAYSAFCADNLTKDEKWLVKTVLATFGEERELAESQMNVATGLCGSGPAFVFKFIDALYQNGVKNGLEGEVALEMALSTVIGSAYLVESYDGNIDIAELVQSVCSKGGTTIEGVNYLDEHDFENVVSSAVDKAIKRAEEMSNLNEKR